MSLDENWPTLPKNIDEKVWQKKKGIAKAKETGVSEQIKLVEAAEKKVKPFLYARASIDLSTLTAAEKASNAIFADTNNVKAYLKALNTFAEHCNDKAAEFKKSILVPKAVREFLEELAGDAAKHAEKIQAHVTKAAEEVEEAKNELGESKNVPLATEKIETLGTAFDQWEKAYPISIKRLGEMEEELTRLNKEMDLRLEGKVDKPTADLKEDLKGLRDEAQKMQDEMLGKKAYVILKAVKEIRGLTKTIKNDKQFSKNVADKFELRANKFLEQREKLNVQSSNVIADAGLSYSLLQDGLKDEEGVMKEVEKFAEMFYSDTNPNSVEKTREHIDTIGSLSKEILVHLKQQPEDVDGLRRLKAKCDNAVVMMETGAYSLKATIKTSARLTRGRFEKHPMIGNALKKMAVDVESIQRDGKKSKELYETKIVPVVEKVLSK
jgi:hypothetical protein